MMMRRPRPPPAPRRCHLIEIPRLIDDGHVLFRLLGTAMAIIVVEDRHRRTSHIRLDDGTDQVVLEVTTTMLASLAIGQTIEVIVRAFNDQTLRVEQLVVGLDDPSSVETLRWLEMDYGPKDADWLGYPSIPALQADDVLDLIESEAMVPSFDGKQIVAGGVTADDLAKVLATDRATIGRLIEELQMAGQVYRTQSGKYMPL